MMHCITKELYNSGVVSSVYKALAVREMTGDELIAATGYKRSSVAVATSILYQNHLIIKKMGRGDGRKVIYRLAGFYRGVLQPEEGKA